VVRKADFVLSQAGGHGAVRELCELILAPSGIRDYHAGDLTNI